MLNAFMIWKTLWAPREGGMDLGLCCSQRRETPVCTAQTEYGAHIPRQVPTPAQNHIYLKRECGGDPWTFHYCGFEFMVTKFSQLPL